MLNYVYSPIQKKSKNSFFQKFAKFYDEHEHLCNTILCLLLIVFAVFFSAFYGNPV